MTELLYGVIPPVPTPFLNGRYDPKSHQRVCRFLVEKRVNGILVLGVTGEAPFVTIDQKMEAIAATSQVPRNDVNFFANITEGNIGDAIKLAQHAEKKGYDALVYAPLFAQNPDPVKDLEKLVGATKKPLVLYSNSEYTHGNEIGKPLVEELLDRFGERIQGIKVSTGPINVCIGVRDDYPYFNVAQGSEQGIMTNPHSKVDAISPSAAVHDPELLFHIYDRICRGEHHKLDTEFAALWNYHQQDKQNGGTIQSIKSRLNRMKFKGALIFKSDELSPKNPNRRK